MSRPVESPAARSRVYRASAPLIVTCLLALGYAALFGWLSLERYWAYEMHALDMGNMGQAAWNTIHGHPFYFTNMRLQYQIEAWYTTTRLSFHVEALFPLISLVYVIYPHPESLLVLQTIALALGAPAVFLLARDVLSRPWLATVFAATYLLFPSLEAMNLYEFHPVSLATPLLLYAFLFARRRHYVPFALCSLAAMGTKEQIGLVVALFGLYIVVVNRSWRVGAGVAAIGVTWSLFAALVVEHHFRQPGSVSYLHSRYGYLGHGPRGVIATLVHHPGSITSHVFTYAKSAYIRQLLAPTGFLAIFAAPLLALALPSLGLNLLSDTSAMYSALGQDSAEIISIIMIASILGCRVVLDVLGGHARPVALDVAVPVVLLGAALWNQHVNGFSPIGARFEIPAVGQHQQVENRFVAMVPSGAPVSTQDELDPHLSSRHYLYLFGDTGRRPDPPLVPADNILLDASGPTYPLTSTELQLKAEEFLRRPGWGVAAAEDGLILLRKHAPSRRVPARFYSYMRPSGPPSHRLNFSDGGLQILGYDVSKQDLPNFRIPRLEYTFYVRAVRRLQMNQQPILYERDGSSAACSSDPLGLAWMPTSRWKPGTTYLVRMAPLDTEASAPGTAKFFVGVTHMAVPHFDRCPPLPVRRANVGSLPLQF